MRRRRALTAAAHHGSTSRTLNTAAITRLLLQEPEPERSPDLAQLCFVCGRTFIKGERRFCSTKCVDAFDGGLPAYEPSSRSRRAGDMKQGRDGYYIDCAFCRQEFQSKGLRFCGGECERKYREGQQREAKLARDPFRTIKPKCMTCRQVMPLWKDGRRVRADRKFCSGKCERRYAKSGGVGSGDQSFVPEEITAKKCP